jgi:hypothetical protein
VLEVLDPLSCLLSFYGTAQSERDKREQRKGTWEKWKCTIGEVENENCRYDGFHMPAMPRRDLVGNPLAF